MMVSNNSKHHIYHRFDQNNPLVVKNIHQRISNATNFTVKRKLFDNSMQEKDFPVRKLSGTFNKIKTKLVQPNHYTLHCIDRTGTTFDNSRKGFSPRKFFLHHVNRDSRDTLV